MTWSITGPESGKLPWMKPTVAAVVALGVSALLAGSAGGAPSAYECRPTPNDGAGPFGRGMPPIRSSTGRGHVLSGTVISALNCAPLARAQVQIMYRGRNGYMRATSGTVITKRDGRFRFESGVPFHYGPPRHFHLRVVAPDHEVLLTRHVVRGRTGTMRLVLEPLAL